MSRLLASLVLTRAKLLPLLIRIEDKARYFKALQAADDSNVLDLAAFIARMQLQARLFLLAEEGCSSDRSDFNLVADNSGVSSRTLLSNQRPPT